MIRALALLCLLTALVGCKIIVPPDENKVKPRLATFVARTIVQSNHPNAECRAVGTNQQVDKRITPYTISPEQMGFPVRVTCELEGFLKTSEYLYPRPVPSLVLGLAQGVKISPMVDLKPAAGAPNDTLVANSIAVILRRGAFNKIEERERFYEILRKDREQRWEKLRSLTRQDCRNPIVPRAGATSVSEPTACRVAYKRLEELRAADLSLLEQERRRATFR